MKILNTIILALCLLSSVVFAADDLSLKVSVDKNKITIGDRIKYEVVLEYNSGVKIEPLGMAQNLGEFEIKDYKVFPPSKLKTGKNTSKTEYIITTFTTGQWTIPSIKIKYKDLTGNDKEISSDEIKIDVEGVKPNPNDTDDIRPLKAPADIKGKFPALVFVSLIVLIIGGIVAFMYFKKKQRILDMPLAPLKPPEVAAREALQALSEMRLIEKGLFKEYYIRISDIIRAYIEARYRIFALDRTTWELYQEMRNKKIDRHHVDISNNFLEECDLVKFAKYTPQQKEAEEMYVKAGEIIDITAEPMQNLKLPAELMRNPGISA